MVLKGVPSGTEDCDGKLGHHSEIEEQVLGRLEERTAEYCDFSAKIELESEKESALSYNTYMRLLMLLQSLIIIIVRIT